MTVDLPIVIAGKVREVYDAGDWLLLIVASDRISAFDVVMAEPVPNKGAVLTAMSVHWLEALADTVPNHLVTTDMTAAGHPELQGRAMLVRRAEMLPVECVVRGYLAGSAWRDYVATGTTSGIRLPEGLRQSDRLPEPAFAPSTKAERGSHDENISFEQAVELVGRDLAERARDLSLALYEAGAAAAAERGMILADTKFELGLVDGELVVADEVMTPDSSRYWSMDSWEPGTTPPAFDKQPVRDYLDGLDWNKEPPPPPLPDDVVAATSRRYVDAYERVTGKQFADWPVAPATEEG